jgi:hypothetical protein
MSLIFNTLMKVSAMLDLKIAIKDLGRYDSWGRTLVFANDSWSDWHPDPERALREHDRERVPYAWMSRHHILACMRVAKGGREWEFYQEYLIDRCTPAERDYDHFVAILLEHGVVGREDLFYLYPQGGVPIRLVQHSETPARAPRDVAGR